MEKIDQTIGVSGLVTTTSVDDDGNMHVTYSQDSAPAFEQVLSVRNDGAAWREGVKKDMVHAFHIPDGVVHELLKIGVNVYKSPLKDVVWGLRKLNRFEACDMTGKRFV